MYMYMFMYMHMYTSKAATGAVDREFVYIETGGGGRRWRRAAGGGSGRWRLGSARLGTASHV